MNRRDFLKIGFVSGTALALGGCARPVETALVSQIDMPEFRLLGKARWFATTCQDCRGGCGVSIKMVDGRAKKIEGLATHPINHGKVCRVGQSALQALYNPDRLMTPLQQGQIETPDWETVLKQIAAQMNAGAARPGSTLIITGRLHGSQGALVAALAGAVGARIWMLETLGGQGERSVMKALTGKAELPYYNLAEADYVVNFGSNFLNHGPAPTHLNWAYGQFRGRKSGRGIMVALGPHMNMTVANADKWFPIVPGSEGWVALALAQALGRAGKKGMPDMAAGVNLDDVIKMAGPEVGGDILPRIAQRLLKARKPLVIAGPEPGAYSNGIFNLTAIHSLNKMLGSLQTYEPDLMVLAPGWSKPADSVFIGTKDAMDALKGGTFQTVWMLDSNPIYQMPSRIGLDEMLNAVPNSVAFTSYKNESSRLAKWVVPLASWLEDWGDNRVDGPFGPGGKTTSVYGLQQAAVALRPGSLGLTDILLYAMHRAGPALQKLATAATTQDLLKQKFPAGWEQTVARGGVWEESPLDWEPYSTKLAPMQPPPALPSTGKPPDGVSPWEHVKPAAVAAPDKATFDGEGKVLIPFVSTVGDGAVSNRPWLQELPDAVTQIVWGEWIEINALVAENLKIELGDLIRVKSRAGSIEGPAYPTSGIHPDAVAVPIGQGHTDFGRYAGRGFGVMPLVVPSYQAGGGELALASTRVTIEKDMSGRTARVIRTDRREGPNKADEPPRKIFE